MSYWYMHTWMQHVFVNRDSPFVSPVRCWKDPLHFVAQSWKVHIESARWRICRGISGRLAREEDQRQACGQNQGAPVLKDLEAIWTLFELWILMKFATLSPKCCQMPSMPGCHDSAATEERNESVVPGHLWTFGLFVFRFLCEIAHCRSLLPATSHLWRHESFVHRAGPCHWWPPIWSCDDSWAPVSEIQSLGTSYDVLRCASRTQALHLIMLPDERLSVKHMTEERERVRERDSV